MNEMARRKSEGAELDCHLAEVNRMWPLFFWYKCAMCGHEIRREWGWEVYAGPYVNGKGHTWYLCGECAPTRDDAVRITNSRAWAGTRPQVKPFPLGSARK